MAPKLPLINQDRLETWLTKVGYPGKPVRWAITPTTGRVLADGWTVYNGDLASLPLDTRMTWSPVDGKMTYHIILHEDTTGQSMVPPELTRLQAELDKRRQEIDAREQQLFQRERQCYDRELDVMKSLAGAVSINAKLDERTGTAVARLKEWESHLVEMQNQYKDDQEYIEQLSDEKNKLAEKNAIAASVVLVTNKIVSAWSLRHVKKFEDLTPEQIADFQGYLIDRAERQFFADMPNPAHGIGESFTRLPKDAKREFGKGIIKWAIVNDPSMITECAREHQEEMLRQKEEQQ